MKAYLDTSVLIALFIDDRFTPRARDFLNAGLPQLHASEFGSAEFASAVALKTRMRVLSLEQAREALAAFDLWGPDEICTEIMTSEDIQTATIYLRRLDLNLRTPDAIHIAIARRIGATLATFDERMAARARQLGLAVADL